MSLGVATLWLVKRACGGSCCAVEFRPLVSRSDHGPCSLAGDGCSASAAGCPGIRFRRMSLSGSREKGA
jgi:hypothetical protein